MPSRNAASREHIAAELMADPGRSDYLIAAVAQASQRLVRVVRREMEGSGEIAPAPPAVRAAVVASSTRHVPRPDA